MKKKDVGPVCGTCRYYIPSDDDRRWGSCHRYAPRPAYEPQTVFWPSINTIDWCGEWWGAYT